MIILIHVKNAIVIIIARVIIIIKKKLYVFFLRIDITNFMNKNKLNKNIYNINILINIFMNLYDNSSIDCNKKNKNKIYDLHNNIVLNKFVHSNKYKSSTVLYYLLFINRSFYY